MSISKFFISVDIAFLRILHFTIMFQSWGMYILIALFIIFVYINFNIFYVLVTRRVATRSGKNDKSQEKMGVFEKKSVKVRKFYEI